MDPDAITSQHGRSLEKDFDLRFCACPRTGFQCASSPPSTKTWMLDDYLRPSAGMIRPALVLRRI
jgi:hypothetical protein